MWIVIIASLRRGFKGQNVPKTVASLAQKGESANTRRLGFVCYKHALIRFLNRFTWKRIQVLRRKHATHRVRKKLFPFSCLFESAQFYPSVAGRSFRTGISRTRTLVPPCSSPRVTKVSIWLCSPVWMMLLPFVVGGQGSPERNEKAENGRRAVQWRRRRHAGTASRGRGKDV